MMMVLNILFFVVGLVGISVLYECITKKKDPDNKWQWVYMFIGIALLLRLGYGCIRSIDIYGDDWSPSEMDPG